MVRRIYEHRQAAPWIFALLGLLFGVVVAVYLTIDEGLLVMAVFVVFALVLVLLFQGLKVEVDAEAVRLAFGIGLIRRSIPRATIVGVKKVRNRWWYGFGVRYTGHGWMWNIAGLNAVELTYQNGKTFRIGTDEPDALLRALRS